MCMLVAQSGPTLCDSMDCRLLYPWDSPEKNIRVGCHSLLQGIFPTQGSNPDLPHCGQILYHLSHQESPVICYNIPFSSCLQSFPASGSFQMSQFFTSGGHNNGVSASASVLRLNIMNIQDCFALGWTVLDCLAVQGTLKSLLQHHSSKASILQCSAFFIVQLSHPYMTTGKTMEGNC